MLSGKGQKETNFVCKLSKQTRNSNSPLLPLCASSHRKTKLIPPAWRDVNIGVSGSQTISRLSRQGVPQTAVCRMDPLKEQQLSPKSGGHLPGGPVVKTLLPLQGTGVQSLVGEPACHKMHSKNHFLKATGGACGKEPACQCRRRGFHPWVGKIPWRRARQPTPVFLPGESHGQRSLVGYSLQSRKESDTTEAT